MKLLTKEIEKKLKKFPLYSQDGKGVEAKVVCKFFAPVGSWTWYVLDGDIQEDGDWMFFGIVVSDYGAEYGYFGLRELESIELPFGLKIERDLYFEGCFVKDLGDIVDF